MTSAPRPPRIGLVATVLAAATAAVYARTFRVPFLFDDQFTVVGNHSIADLRRLDRVLAPRGFTVVGRPLLNFTFALNRAWTGLQPWSYHAVNLLGHILAGLALFGLVRRTLLSPACRDRFAAPALPLATAVAALWMLHPLQTESVTYVSQRAESMMGLFYLLTLYCFVRCAENADAQSEVAVDLRATVVRPATSLTVARRSTATPWAAWSVLSCLLGMSTKEVMVTAPVLVLLYDRAFFSPSIRSALVRRKAYYAALAGTWAWLAVLMASSHSAQRGMGYQSGVTWLRYALTEFKAVALYLKLAFWPHPLVFDYGPEMLATPAGQIVPCAAVVILAVIAAGWAWRRSPPIGFVAASFFVLLAPTSSIVPVAGQPMAENRMYLPLASLAVLVVLGAFAAGGRRALAALAGGALGLGGLTLARNQDYRSVTALWQDTLAKRPASARAENNLGQTLAREPGQGAAAIAHFEAAIRLMPDYAEAHNNLAVELAKIPGRQAEALDQYRQALRLDPRSPEAHNNLAVALDKTPGREAEAIAQFEEALRLDPQYASAHRNLASALAAIPGRLSDSVAHWEAALRLEPDNAPAHYNLAVELTRIPGHQAEAVENYERAIRLQPDMVEARNNLAVLLEKIPGRLPEGIAQLEEAVRLRPDSAGLRNNLALALARQTGRLDDAIRQMEAAMQLDPGNADFEDTLARLRAWRAQGSR